VTEIDLDHLAIGVTSIDDALAWARHTAGGREVARFQEASWLGAQAAFAAGIRLEMLEPITDPADDFLRRFLEHTGPGPHHVTFKVPDIVACIERLRGWGIEPVKPNLDDPNWKECFLHPKMGLGTVVQLAQPGGEWSAERVLPPAPPDLIHAHFLGAEVRADPAMTTRIFGELLGGATAQVDGGVAYSWPGGGTIVVRPADDRQGVERVVFRILGLPTDGVFPDRETRLHTSPVPALRIPANEVWPAEL
jgi:methylmalonyl-CoA/ethylmalonyl-CoA epimerase